MAVDYKALKNGGFMRQVQKDRFSLRLRVVGGNLSADQLAAIAEVAKKFGDGRVHLTSRQSVEIPFIHLEDVDAVKAALREGGVDTGVCGPSVRTVTACQGNAICPSGCIDTYPLAVKISQRYYGRELPHKFKIGITGCMNNCLKAEENDLGIKGGYELTYDQEKCTLCSVCQKACRKGAIRIQDGNLLLSREACNHCGRCVKSCPKDAWQGKSIYVLSFGGTFGNRIASGEQVLAPIEDVDDVLRAADAALAFFDRHANPGERLRTAIDRAGWDIFQKEMEEAFHG